MSRFKNINVVYGTFYDPEGNRLQAASSAGGG